MISFRLLGDFITYFSRTSIYHVLLYYYRTINQKNLFNIKDGGLAESKGFCLSISYCHSTVIDLLLISWDLVFFGSSSRSIPLLSALAVTSDERISSGTGILQ